MRPGDLEGSLAETACVGEEIKKKNDPNPKFLILRAPGTKCDEETAFAFEKAGAATETLHVNRLLESPAVLDRFQILCIPGGFSFGDDVAAGQIFAVQMRHHLAGRLADFKAAGN